MSKEFEKSWHKLYNNQSGSVCEKECNKIYFELGWTLCKSSLLGILTKELQHTNLCDKRCIEIIEKL